MQGHRGGGGASAAPVQIGVEELEKMVESLLTFARVEIQNDRPNEALNAVVHAIRLSRGEEGIAAVLVEARKRSEPSQKLTKSAERLCERSRC